MNPIVLRVLNFILPVLVKCIPDLINKFLTKRADKGMNVKFSIIDDDGNPVKGATVVLQFNSSGKIEGETDEFGEISIAGITFNQFSVDVIADGFKRDVTYYMNTGKDTEYNIVLHKQDSNIELKTISDAKYFNRDTQLMVAQSKDSIKQALKDGAYSAIEDCGSDLVGAVVNRLRDSVTYYKGERSKVELFKNWGDTLNYLKFTGLIFGTFLIQKDLEILLQVALRKISLDK